MSSMLGNYKEVGEHVGKASGILWVTIHILHENHMEDEIGRHHPITKQ
jgi:hypothetical protein